MPARPRRHADGSADEGGDGGGGAAASPAAAATATVDLTFLQGVRAAACLGVVLLHSFMYWQALVVPYDRKYQLTAQHPLIRQVPAAASSSPHRTAFHSARPPASLT